MTTKTTEAAALCTLSGGYDSTAALLWSLERWSTVGLFVNYGQPYANQEIEATAYVVRHPRVRKHENWRGWKIVGADMQSTAGDPWVPYRNLVIAALATNRAVAIKAGVVVFGSKSKEYRPDDPISYLDSTEGFYRALEQLVREITDAKRSHRIPRYALPMLGKTKREVLRYIKKEGDLDLRRLWNCYREDGEPEPCNQCLHCKETQPLVEAVLAEEEF